MRACAPQISVLGGVQLDAKCSIGELDLPITEETVHSLPELIDTVLKIGATLPVDHFLWFRGLAKSSHKLCPKIMRDGKDISDVFDREERLITRFRQRSIAYWQEGYGQNDWDQLFAMQHYGFPTRLLDWSENLMVAAFFALQGHSSREESIEDHPVIWCVDPISWNRGTPSLSGFGNDIHVLTTASEDADIYRPLNSKKRQKYPVSIFGSHNSKRIVAQRGTFFVWGNDTSSLEDFANGPVKSDLFRVILDANPSNLFDDIRRIGFTETMIFPEMPYLANELTRMEGWRK